MAEITLLLVSVTDCNTGVKSSKLFNLENNSYCHYSFERGILDDITVFTVSYDSEKEILKIPASVFNITGDILMYLLDDSSLDLHLGDISIVFC